jgi:hypothetical protein
VNLVEYVTPKVAGKAKTTAVTLATGKYTLAAGATGVEQMILTPKGVHVLAHAKKHHLPETVIAGARGGQQARGGVAVS